MTELNTLWSNKLFRFWVIGSLIRYLSSLLFDSLEHTSFGNIIIQRDYTVAQFIFYVGEPLKDIFFSLGIIWVLGGSKVVKSLAVLSIDYSVIDILFLVFSYPFEVNRSKWLQIILATLLFVPSYYLIIKNHGKGKIRKLQNRN